MLMLTPEGWINAISATILVIFGCIFGLSLLVKSIISRVKLLSYMSLGIFFTGFLWIGNLLDFFSILITGNNLDNTNGLIGIISWMWYPLVSVFLSYIIVELIMPSMKRLVISITIILGIIFELFIFLDPMGTIDFVYPSNPGENLIDDNLSLNSILFVLLIAVNLYFIIIGGLGFLYKSFQAKGRVKKKFLFLSIAVIGSSIFGVLDGLTTDIILIFVRTGLIASLIFFYPGLREEPVKKMRSKKELEIESDLFRFIKNKPKEITEEEVSISKEKKICLVCKGKVGGFNFVCNECGAFYCDNCVKSLIELENMCWVCNTPFDESKPSKPYEKEDKELELKIQKNNKKQSH